MRRRAPVDVVLHGAPVPEEGPDAVGAVHGQLWVLVEVVPRPWIWQRGLEAGRGCPQLPSLVDRHANVAGVVQPGRVGLDIERIAPILAPVDAGLVPSHPDAILAIGRQADIGLEPASPSYWSRRVPVAPGFACKVHVVPGRFAVLVPCHVYGAVAVAGDRRFPAIPSGGRADSRGSAPTAGRVVAAVEDAEAIVAGTLPDQMDRTVRAPHCLVVDIWLGGGGQAFDRAPDLAVKGPRVEIPVAADLLGPQDPDLAFGVFRYGRPIDVSVRRTDCVWPFGRSGHLSRQDAVGVYAV